MLRVFATIVCVLGLVAGVRAEDRSTPTQQANGEISAVANNQISITDKGGNTSTYQVSNQGTQVILNARRQKTSDLEKKQQVTIIYRRANGQNVANVIADKSSLVYGKIKSVAGDNKQFSMTDADGKNWDFQFNASDKADTARAVLSNGKDTELSKLTAGNICLVIYYRDGQKNMTVEVRQRQ